MTVETQSERVARALASIQARVGAPVEVALVLGSGLGHLADAVTDVTVIPYSEINGFPVSTAPGHKGQLVIGDLFGRRTVVMQGRLHLYEGWQPRDIGLAVYLLRALGAVSFVVTNAAGGLNGDYRGGDIMLIEDHMNMTGASPLVGPNDDAIGLRFPDQTRLYDPDLRALAEAAARASETPMHRGIYCGLIGPELETAAERRFYRAGGGDAVGMSTVLEVIAANHAGMKVLGISAITNAATGVGEQEADTIEVIVEVAQVCGRKIETVLSRTFPNLPIA